MADPLHYKSVNYESVFVKAIEEGDPQKADGLARRLQAQSRIFVGILTER